MILLIMICPFDRPLENVLESSHSGRSEESRSKNKNTARFLGHNLVSE